jgi:hypothetical protein
MELDLGLGGETDYWNGRSVTAVSLILQDISIEWLILTLNGEKQN